MGFKRMGFMQGILTALLVLFSVALGCLISARHLHLSILLAALVLISAAMLYLHLSRTQREILFFFKALENDDQSFSIPDAGHSKLIRELNSYLQVLNRVFRELKIKTEMREQYFSQILEKLHSGLLVMSKTGYVNHINREALMILGLPHLPHIDALQSEFPALFSAIRHMKPQEQGEVAIKDHSGGIKRKVGLQMVEIELHGEQLQVLTLQDLSVQLERKEIEDWIKLIRIMSHEIMNSLAPITSLSATLTEIWSEEQDHRDPKIKQTLNGLEAIAEQSRGLTTFFESYRTLSRIPDPHIRPVFLGPLLEKLETLLGAMGLHKGVDMSFDCRETALQIKADEQMIIQVLINLVKNAIQAVEGVDQPSVRVLAKMNSGRVVMEVIDNGPGIPEDIREEIFVPFFTTRDQGSGVGLSYSRQVMNLNRGRIEFESSPGNTCFRLIF